MLLIFSIAIIFFVVYALYSKFYTLYSTFYALYTTLYTLYTTFYALYTICALHTIKFTIELKYLKSRTNLWLIKMTLSTHYWKKHGIWDATNKWNQLSSTTQKHSIGTHTLVTAFVKYLWPITILGKKIISNVKKKKNFDFISGIYHCVS